MSETELTILKRLISEQTKWVVFSNNISISLLVIAFILLIIAIVMMIKANRTSKRLNMNVETVSNNIMDNNELVKESKRHYEAIESSSTVLLNAELEMQKILGEIQVLMGEIKTEAGSVRHETVEQTRNIDTAFTRFNKEFSTNVKCVTDIIAKELEIATTTASKENIEARQATIKLFDEHMLGIHKSIVKAVKLTSDITFQKATDVVGMALRDDAERNVKIFVPALNDVLLRQQKVVMQLFSMLKEIEKNDGVVLRFINEQELEASKMLAIQISENSEKQKAKDEINMILEEHGFDRIAKENEKLERIIVSDEAAIALFNDINEIGERI